MRKGLFRVSIALLTFFLGTFAALITQAFTRAYLEYDSVRVPEEYALHQPAVPRKHQFYATYRACKPGYVQGYETDDGQTVRERVAPAAENAWGNGFRQRIRAARLPRTYVRQYTDHRGKVGERYILENDPNELGEESVTILFYEGGGYYSFIDAPSLELALEFEQYLIDTDLSASEKYRVLR